MIRFLFGLLTLLVLAAGGVLILLENPDRFKSQITGAVEAGSGYTMTIKGELSWRYWPPIAINVSDIELAVPGESPFASVESMAIDVDLLPLLTQQTAIDINEISVSGGRINLLVNAAGQPNWSVPDTADTQIPPTGSEPGAMLSPTIEQLGVEDLGIVYRDQQSGTDIEIMIESLVTSRLSADLPFDMSAKVNLTDRGASINAEIETTGRLLYKSDTSNINFNELVTAIQLTLEDTRYPSISFNSTGEWRNEDQELVLNQNSIQVSAAAVTTKGVVSLAGDQPRFDGAVQLDIADPARLGRDLDIELPLDYLQIKTDISATPDVLQLVTMEGSFDDSSITGTATIMNSKPFFMEADVRIDQLNTARYLGPQDSGGKGAGSQGSGDDLLIPYESLRPNTFDATIRIARLEHDGQVFNDTKSVIRNKHWTLTSNTSTYNFDGKLVVQTNTQLKEGGSTRIRASLDRLDASQIIGYEGFSGRLSANSDLAFTGHSLNDISSTLTGKTSFNIADGTLDVRPIKNLAATIERLRGKPSPISQWPDVMPFKRMVGQHVFNEGTRSGQVLAAEFENLQISALGGFDLSRQTLGYDVSAIFREPKPGQFDVGDELLGIRWPMTCEGSFADAPADLCFGQEGAITDLVAEIAKQEIKRRGNEKLQEVLGDKVPEEYRQLTEELFKNLFN